VEDVSGQRRRKTAEPSVSPNKEQTEGKKKKSAICLTQNSESRKRIFIILLAHKSRRIDEWRIIKK
jgi:hypothetical protein